MDPRITEERADRLVVSRTPRTLGLDYSALAVPLFAMALVVARERLGWPDEEKVREISAALMYERSEGA